MLTRRAATIVVAGALALVVVAFLAGRAARPQSGALAPASDRILTTSTAAPPIRRLAATPSVGTLKQASARDEAEVGVPSAAGSVPAPAAQKPTPAPSQPSESPSAPTPSGGGGDTTEQAGALSN